MKVLLTSLRNPFIENDRIYPALANLYLKANLNNHGIESKVTDNWKDEDLSKYTHVGVSIMTPQRSLAGYFLEYMNKNYPNTIMIAGGPHVNYYTTETLEQPWNYVVRGEGERILPQILNNKIEEKLVIEKLTRKDMNNLPRPDRLGCKDYLKNFNYNLEGRKSTTMITARGCPERCHFCEDAMTPVLQTPIEKIKLELDDIVNLGYGGVYIFDDIFALAQKVTEPICKELSKRDLIYRCNGQARMMNESFMRMLAETGCREIAFGAESGSQKILDNIEKRTTVQQNYEFVRLAKKYQIPLKLFILIGLPGEDWKTLSETEKFIKDADAEDFQVAIYYPFKGTQIRDKIDKGEEIDMIFYGEGMGLGMGMREGKVESLVRTKSIGSGDLQAFRDHLIKNYRKSNKSKQKQREEEDDFFKAHDRGWFTERK